MSDPKEQRDDEEQARTRPKVVDKRVSAGGHRPSSSTIGAEPTPEAPAAPPPPPSERSGEAAAPEPPSADQGRVWTPEQEAEAQRVAQEIADRPSLEWVVTSAVNLANVAGVKLQMGEVEDARLAIDALAALVNSLTGRLDDAEGPLRETLAQLQMAFTQRATGPPPPA